VVTSGQHHLTPQHPPRDASPAGLVGLWLLGPFLLSCFVTTFLGVLLWNIEFMLCIFSRLLSIAEETLTEFLSKATGTAVEWVQMPGMKVSLRAFLFFILIHFINEELFSPIKKNANFNYFILFFCYYFELKEEY